MDKVENGGMRKDLPRTSAGFAPADPYASSRSSPPPGYTQTSYNNNMTPAPPLPPPNYGIPANGAPPQPAVNGTYHNAVPGDYRLYLPKTSKKSVVEAYILAVSPFGLLGAHHFYLQRYYWGLVYFFTCGLLGCGYLIDWFRIPCLVKQANEKNYNRGGIDQKTVSDAYTMWFPMGLLGAHHYYLENYAWGVVYTCTAGLCGIGWIVDAFRMPCLVRSSNERQQLTEVEEKSTCLTVALVVSPFGVLGAHHYYLNRPVWGVVYTFTLGLVGVGWVFDWFRLCVLVKRANREIRDRCPPNRKTIDDTYILWFTFGLLGFHHFYLGRPLWGLLYFFTLGIGGIGWLADVSRIPCLVKEANLKMEAEQEQRSLVSSSAGQAQGQLIFTTVGVLPIQGYTNYSMANPAAFVPNNPIQVYPSQGYNYQQGGVDVCQQASQNFPPGVSLYYQTVNNGSIGGPQFSASAPPPYQPSEPGHVDNHGDDSSNNSKTHKG